MDKLFQKELNVIKNFCGENYARRLSAIQERQEDNVVKIVNTGMVNSGKSSLYNVLINSTEEYFPTGAARTTVKSKAFDYKNIFYVDTPGIDVRDEDDALAFDTIMEADVIVMIHNIRTGPLNRSETDWLEQIVRGMGSVQMCQSRIVFVVSWKDTREKEKGYSELIENLKKQVFEIIRGEIPFFEVSVKKYQQGVEKEKDVLVQRSGIRELQAYLEDYAEQYLENRGIIDTEEYRSTILEVKKILQQTRDTKITITQKIHNDVCNNYKSRKNAWTQVYDYFSTQRKKLSSLEGEVKNM